MAEQVFFFFFTVVLLTVEKQSEHVWYKRPESDPRGLRHWGERDVEVADIFKKKRIHLGQTEWSETWERKREWVKRKERQREAQNQRRLYHLQTEWTAIKNLNNDLIKKRAVKREKQSLDSCDPLL